MKVIYSLGNVTFEQECENRKKAFEFIGAIGEAFPSEPCGCCKSKNTAPSHKKRGDYVFYEMVCRDCTAALKIVCLDNGHMFPSRQNKEKQVLPNNGWSIYQKSGSSQHDAAEHKAPEFF